MLDNRGRGVNCGRGCQRQVCAGRGNSPKSGEAGRAFKKGLEEKLTINPRWNQNENEPSILTTGVLTIRGKVTEMDPGSWAKRFWIRFGAGKTRVEITGEISDAQTQTPLIKFKHATVTLRRMVFYRKALSRDVMNIAEDIGEMLLRF